MKKDTVAHEKGESKSVKLAEKKSGGSAHDMMGQMHKAAMFKQKKK